VNIAFHGHLRRCAAPQFTTVGSSPVTRACVVQRSTQALPMTAAKAGEPIPTSHSLDKVVHPLGKAI